MVKLVADARHLEPVDHLAVARAGGIGVDRAQIVRLLDAGAGVDGDGVEQRLARRPHRLGGAGIARAAALAHDRSPLPRAAHAPRPRRPRAMTSFMISLVPAYILSMRLSRYIRSIG